LIRSAQAADLGFILHSRHQYHWHTGYVPPQTVAAPHLGAGTGFDKQEYRLYPVGVETWGGFVFVHLTPAEAKPLPSQLAGIPERLARYPLATLAIGATIRYRTATGDTVAFRVVA